MKKRDPLEQVVLAIHDATHLIEEPKGIRHLIQGDKSYSDLPTNTAFHHCMVEKAKIKGVHR